MAIGAFGAVAILAGAALIGCVVVGVGLPQISPEQDALRDYYQAADITGWADLKNVPAWLERFLARPAVHKGLNIPPRG